MSKIYITSIVVFLGLGIGHDVFAATLALQNNVPPEAEIGRSYTHSFCEPMPISGRFCGKVFSADNDTKNPIGGKPPYTFTAGVGLPFGLRMNLNGVITGTPKSNTPLGSRKFQVCVKDSIGKRSCTFTTIKVLPKSIVLNINKLGDGDGKFTYSPQAMKTGCDGLCIGFKPGTTITLNALANEDSIFSGWSGACSGTGVCKVKLDKSQKVSAIFTKKLNWDDLLAKYSQEADASDWSWLAVDNGFGEVRYYRKENGIWVQKQSEEEAREPMKKTESQSGLEKPISISESIPITPPAPKESTTVKIDSVTCTYSSIDKPYKNHADAQYTAEGIVGGPEDTTLDLPYWWPYTGNGAMVDCGSWYHANPSSSHCSRKSGQPATTKWKVISQLTGINYTGLSGNGTADAFAWSGEGTASDTKTAQCVIVN